MYSYNLALCYRRLGDIPAALGHLDQAAMGTADPKRKLKLKQLRTALVTGEQSPNLKNDDRESANKINQMMESIGFEASVDEGPPTLRPQTEDGAGSVRSALSPVATAARKPARRSVSLCQALSAVKGPLAQTPTVTFDLANCAEDNDRPADAAQLLAHYLEITPSAADVDRVGLRIASLKALAALPGQKGAQVRSLYASASRSLEARRYDDALADFQKAAAAAPEFAPSEWRLALLYEAMGNVEQARRHFSLYRQLDSNPAGQQEADLHLDTLEAKRIMYDQEVDRASPNDLRAIWCHSCESNELRRVRGATTPTSPRCSP
jgi:tetratricopeptide (TPR) repeat protein